MQKILVRVIQKAFRLARRVPLAVFMIVSLGFLAGATVAVQLIDVKVDGTRLRSVSTRYGVDYIDFRGLTTRYNSTSRTLLVGPNQDGGVIQGSADSQIGAIAVHTGELEMTSVHFSPSPVPSPTIGAACTWQEGYCRSYQGSGGGTHTTTACCCYNGGASTVYVRTACQ